MLVIEPAAITLTLAFFTSMRERRSEKWCRKVVGNTQRVLFRWANAGSNAAAEEALSALKRHCRCCARCDFGQQGD